MITMKRTRPEFKPKQFIWITVVVLLGLPSAILGQVMTRGCLTIGTSSTEIAQAVKLTPDSGYIIVGYTYSSSANGSADGYIIKLDKTGSIEWTRAIGSSGFDVFFDVVILPDGSYVATGHTNGISVSLGDNSYNVFVVRFSSNGNVLWSKVFGEASLIEQSFGVIYDSGGRIVIVGRKQFPNGSGDEAVLVLRLDVNGNIIDHAYIGTYQWFNAIQEVDYARDVVETSDGNYVITGLTRCPTCSSQDILLLKVRGTDLSPIWARALDASDGNMDEGYVIIEDKASRDLIVGGYAYISGSSDAYIARLSSDAITFRWKLALGGNSSDVAYDMILLDGRLFVVGETRSFGAGNYDLYHVAIRANDGYVYYTKTYGSAQSNYGRGIDSTWELSGVDVVMVGAFDHPTPNYDAYLIKLDRTGADCGCVTGSGGNITTRGTINSISVTSRTSMATRNGGNPISNIGTLNSSCLILPQNEAILSVSCRGSHQYLRLNTESMTIKPKYLILEQVCDELPISDTIIFQQITHDDEDFAVSIPTSNCYSDKHIYKVMLMDSMGNSISQKYLYATCPKVTKEVTYALKDGELEVFLPNNFMQFPITIELLTITGKVIYRQALYRKLLKHTIPISNVPNQLLLLHIYSNSYQWKRKLLIR